MSEVIQDKIVRLDDNPSAVFYDLVDCRFVAIDNRRALIKQSRLPKGLPTDRLDTFFSADELRSCEATGKEPRIYFRHPDVPDCFWRQASTPRLVADDVWFVRNGRSAFRAVVISTSVALAHAISFDASDHDNFTPVAFRLTPVPRPLWAAAGYSAVVTHRGKNYGTIAPFGVGALAASFGNQFTQGTFDVVDPATGERIHHA